MSKVKLPCHECKGQCCTYPAFTEAEITLARMVHGVPPGTQMQKIEMASSYTPDRVGGTAYVLSKGSAGVCPYLSPTGCKLGDLRPRVCKDYGEVEALPCQYLYPDKAQAMQEKWYREAKAPKKVGLK